jgi:hypothetical protein
MEKVPTMDVPFRASSVPGLHEERQANAVEVIMTVRGGRKRELEEAGHSTLVACSG